jgi:phosphorylase/glycogen(starch) synthase
VVNPENRYNPEQILYRLWDRFGVDSIAGGYDYIEPVMFATAAGEIIATIANHGENRRLPAYAHFHEWMTGAGLLRVNEEAPHVSTVFTTHATVVGRAMVGAGHNIYVNLDEVAPAEEARHHNVVAKHSMESVSARQADCFTTVSPITAKEAHRMLGIAPQVLTPNGIDIHAIEDLSANREPAERTRRKLMDLANGFLGEQLPDSTRLFLISGRYEFANKGIDVFLESLALIKSRLTQEESAVAFICIPCEHMERRTKEAAGGTRPQPPAVCTHRLRDENHDAILTTCLRLGLTNRPEDRLRVIYIPVYLSEGDGVLDMPYYEVLQGFDMGVFPSKYEPWGYTPLESAAYSVPTLTTDQTGFGKWAEPYLSSFEKAGVILVPRLGREDKVVVEDVARHLRDSLTWSREELLQRRKAARSVAEKASWEDFYAEYMHAYEYAGKAAEKRVARTRAAVTGRTGQVGQARQSAQPHFRTFMVETQIPAALSRLRELAHNLWWSWHPAAIELFARLDPYLWERLRHNPVRLLEELPAERLEEIALNQEYRALYQSVLTAFDAYLSGSMFLCPALEENSAISWQRPVAYFSTEFGLHESLPIYSGGLGVLSGDHLKTASDLSIPLVGVGLFYQHGYFSQSIDSEFRQVAESAENDPSGLPLKQVLESSGAPALVAVEMPGRTLYASVWKTEVGRVTLYMLDTNVAGNTPQDRKLTSQLYVADVRLRLEQEILLGIGGARLLRLVSVRPQVYHINEGHSAFLVLENIRHACREHGMSFDEARALVRSQVVFTTHTPVDAGNERFPSDLIQHYFAHYIKEMGLSAERFLDFGRLASGDPSFFVMTILALRFASATNGVSQLHGRVARRMWEAVWPGVPGDMTPITAVTNGVHAATFMGPEMRELLDTYLGMNWDGSDVMDREKWQRVEGIPDDLLWGAKLEMKQRLIGQVKEQLAGQWARFGEMARTPEELNAKIRSSSLTIGFARRFATYKRAGLLFRDLDRLDTILNNPRRPVQIIFSGKAHPNDGIAKDLLSQVVRLSRDPRFAGRFVFLEDYDLATARLLVQGVDVWLNTPSLPQEASGTSGQKAGLNGAINCSVADGWWWEGAEGDNGWTIGPAPENVDEESESNDAQDAEHLYSLLEDTIVPLYYQRNAKGIPEGWLRVMRRSMETVGPRFCSHRMLVDYFNQLYVPVARRAQEMEKNKGAKARELAGWKRRAASRFSSIQVLDITTQGLENDCIQVGRVFSVEVHVDLGESPVDEIRAELVVGRADANQRIRQPEIRVMDVAGQDGTTVTYRSEFAVQDKGTFSYGILIFPYHASLCYKYDVGLVIWA